MLTNQIFSGPNLCLLRSSKVSSRPADSLQERGDYAEVKKDCVTVQTKVTEVCIRAKWPIRPEFILVSVVLSD